MYYRLPLHFRPCYTDPGYGEGDCPVNEKLADESLALAIHSELAADDIDYICQLIRGFYK